MILFLQGAHKSSYEMKQNSKILVKQNMKTVGLLPWVPSVDAFAAVPSDSIFFIFYKEILA